jgi:hypothetical protein
LNWAVAVFLLALTFVSPSFTPVFANAVAPTQTGPVPYLDVSTSQPEYAIGDTLVVNWTPPQPYPAHILLWPENVQAPLYSFAMSGDQMSKGTASVYTFGPGDYIGRWDALITVDAFSYPDLPNSRLPAENQPQARPQPSPLS